MDLANTEEFPVLVHWQQPRALIGAGASELAAPQAAAMGLKHVLFVTSGLTGTGIVDDIKGQFEAAGRVGDRLRQGRVQPQGLQRHGLVPALHRREVRRLRLDRRRLVHRLRQGCAGRGRPRRAQHQRVPGHQRVGEARQPAAHRDQHHGRDRLGDHAVLRDHRHHLRERAAQVGRLRPGDHHHAGHQRPRADDDPAAADRRLHGLRHPGPRHRELHQPRGHALDHARVPARGADGRGEPARGRGQPAQRRRR